MLRTIDAGIAEQRCPVMLYMSPQIAGRRHWYAGEKQTVESQLPADFRLLDSADVWLLSTLCCLRFALMPSHHLQVALNNGVEMPLVGFGTAGLGAETKQAVAWALQAGYRLLDSAQVRESSRCPCVCRAGLTDKHLSQHSGVVSE